VSAQGNAAQELSSESRRNKTVQVVSSEKGEQGVPVKSTDWSSSTSIIFHPIGIVRSPFQKQEGTPLQPVYSEGTRAKVIVFPPYVAALKDLEGFSHVWLLCYFDRACPWQPVILPYKDTQERGLFATRAPSRPNAIGMSVVKLVGIKENEIEIEGVDILDNTPLLDIKPYVVKVDSIPKANSGWLDRTTIHRNTADDRFQIK
jgi:tRNA-Thr(GGU) m(6)t(6)A37 methyltransferase TsaA